MIRRNYFDFCAETVSSDYEEDSDHDKDGHGDTVIWKVMEMVTVAVLVTMTHADSGI